MSIFRSMNLEWTLIYQFFFMKKCGFFHPIKLSFDAEAAERILKVIKYKPSAVVIAMLYVQNFFPKSLLTAHYHAVYCSQMSHLQARELGLGAVPHSYASSAMQCIIDPTEIACSPASQPHKVGISLGVLSKAFKIVSRQALMMQMSSCLKINSLKYKSIKSVYK